MQRARAREKAPAERLEINFFMAFNDHLDYAAQIAGA